MVSTYLSYDLINRDMKASLTRVSQQGLVERQTDYYKENIGKVTSVDEFLDDYQLYNYAVEAFGLSEMAYARAFMKDVLESDLNDENSFANKLTDTRYREFAAAFNFTAATETVQTEAQLDEMIGLYGTSITDLDDSLAEETRYYKIVIDEVENVDQLLRNDRMRAYIFQVFDIDESTYSYAHVRGLLTSNLDDEDSYINQTYGAAYSAAVEKLAIKANIELYPQLVARIAAIDTALAGSGLTDAERAALQAEKVERAEQKTNLDEILPPQSQWASTVASIKAEQTKLTSIINQFTKLAEIAAAFEFNADGTVAKGAAQADDNVKSMTELYISKSPRVTPTVAVLNQEYFQSRLASIKSVEELTSDSRLLNYVKTAFDLTEATIVPATIKNILTSDLSDPKNYIATFGNNDKRYIALRNAFNFQTDGTLAAGAVIQTAAQTSVTNNGYMTHYNDKDDKADARALQLFQSDIRSVKSVADFLKSTAVQDYALKAVGLDPDDVTPRMLRQILTSDLQDPKSFVNSLDDDRYVKLAELFNFKADGTMAAPLLAQSELTLQQTSANYIKEKSVFGTADDRTLAEKEAEYYGAEIQKVKSLKDLLGNPRLLAFTMEANGIDPASVTTEQLYDIFTSDLDDPNSYINEEADPAFRGLVTSFNFDPEGNLLREDSGNIQGRRGLYETLDKYLEMTLETQQGESNAGVRLALYFNRMATGITSYYTILADTAIQEFINTTFGIPDELANADVDTQVDMMKKYFDIEDFRDPDELKRLIARFTIMYDTENGAADPVLSLFGGSTSISADTLLSVAMLRAG